MTVETMVFWLMAVVTVFAAVVSTCARSVINAAYGLFFALLGLAGAYVLLGADFLAVTQVVIYVGGILVLLLFGVLLTNRNFETLVTKRPRMLAVAAIPGLIVFLALLAVILNTKWSIVERANPHGTTISLGCLLLRDYLLPFEFSSLTLLAALIGAAYLVRSRERDQ